MKSDRDYLKDALIQLNAEIQINPNSKPDHLFAPIGQIHCNVYCKVGVFHKKSDDKHPLNPCRSNMWPRQESNPYLKFRKLLFYPRPTGVSRAGVELRHQFLF
jgi:hypothetical protein